MAASGRAAAGGGANEQQQEIDLDLLSAGEWEWGWIDDSAGPMLFLFAVRFGAQRRARDEQQSGRAGGLQAAGRYP
jgi:hypothetical protein